ncbi:MAG: ABC transporter ATP-binding protein/permease [Lachnospiraceae bacterium]|nr:ABC transporter ATP-binding protein/permease [Lachnospiraceae bacterium]
MKDNLNGLLVEARGFFRKKEICIYSLKFLNTVFDFGLPFLVSSFVTHVTAGEQITYTEAVLSFLYIIIGAIVFFTGSNIKDEAVSLFQYVTMRKIWEHNMFADYKAYRERKHDEDIQTIFLVTGDIGNYYYDVIPELLFSFLMVCGCIYAVIKTALADSVIIIAAVFAATVIIRIIGRAWKKAQNLYQDVKQERITYLTKIMEEIRSVKLFALYDVIDKHIERLEKIINKRANHMFYMEKYQKKIYDTVKYISLGYGLFLMTIKGTMKIADFVLYEQTIALLFSNLNNFVSKTNDINKKQNATKRLSDLFLPEDKQGSEKLSGINDVTLDHISFEYEENKPIYDNFSLKFESGKSYLLKAPNGFGKTTLFNLILGIEKPNKGAIRINGKDICELDLGYLRRHEICTLFQEDYYSEDSLFKNVGNYLDAGSDDGVVNRLEQLGMAYEDKKGDFNHVFSGGQLKKLSLAILEEKVKNAQNPLILMDEPTNMLDEATVQKVIEYIGNIGKEAILVIISHDQRLDGTVDEVIILSEGGKECSA